jgi:hypothetical protein
MNLKKWGLFTVLLVLFLASCKERNREVLTQPPKEVHDTLAVLDTVFVPSPYPVPVPYEIIRDSVVYREASAIVDTLAILDMFNHKRVHNDTLRFEFGYLLVTDTIKGGAIVSRNYLAKVKMPQSKEKIRIVEEEPKNKYYVGTNFAFDQPNYVYSLGASFLYETKNDKIYEIGLGVRNRVLDGNTGVFMPHVRGGVYWKLK